MMEYEKKYRPKWYQLMLLIIYSVAVIYTVLVNNPYLYSGKLFQEALAGKKDNSYAPVVTELGRNKNKLSAPQNPMRFSWNKNASDESGETRDRRYVELTLTPLLIELDKKPENPKWTMFKDHIVMSDNSSTVYGFNFEGKTLWQFSSDNHNQGSWFPEPVADETTIYLVNSAGYLYNLNLQDGKLLWAARFDGEFLSDAFISENSLLILQKIETTNGEKKKPTTEARLLRLDRKSGNQMKTSEDLGLKQLTNMSHDQESKTLFLTSAEKLVAVQLPEMKSLWQKSLSSDVLGPAVVAGNKVVVSLKEGKIKIFSLSRGTEIHEIDLEHPVASPVAFIPIYNRAAVTTTDGYQHVIDLDGGKRLWRFDLNNKNNIWSSWSTRLSGNFIEELEMKWRYKGWTIWSPCVEKRICIYNPEKGQIVGRVMLGGQLASLPKFREKSFYVLLEKETGFSLGHYMERPAAKQVSQSREAPPSTN